MGSRIGTKFVVVVGLAGFVYAAVCFCDNWATRRRHLIDLRDQNAELALAFDLAIREYVSSAIRPEMQKWIGNDEFIPETMSTSFVARRVFEKVQKKFPECLLKFSADNPRNPVNQATAEELERIHYFQQHPEVTEWSGFTSIGGKQYYALFSPRRMKENCLRCHGRPEDAPASLVAQYGSEAGFGRSVGDVVALDTIAIPTQSAEAVLAGATWPQVIKLGMWVAGMLGVVFLAFRWMVGGRVERIVEQFRAALVTDGHTHLRPIDVRGNDEIASLAKGFNALAERVNKGQQDLERKIREQAEEVEQRKRTEDELRAAYGDMEQIFNAAPPMAVIDLQGTILDANNSCAAFCRVARSELIGKKCREMMQGRACGTADCCIQRVLSGRGCGAETEKRFSDGTLVTCLIKPYPYRDAQGKLIGMVQTITDITERKKMDQALLDSEHRYRTLYESSQDAIMTATPEEGFLSGNPATVEMFGCENEEEFVQYGPADLSPPLQPNGEPSSTESQRLMAIAMQQGAHSFEWKHCRLDGMEFFASVLLTRMELGGRQVLQATVRDITRQKETEAALREQEKQLRRQDKMSAIGSLAGGVAHEFNNLLQAIRGHTQFAMEKLPSEEQPYQDLEQALAASGRAADLTSHLLNFSRRDSANLENVDVNRVVGELSKMLRPLIGEHIELKMLLDEEAGTVRADGGLLQQAVMNLCVNARDAMPSGGTITIRTDSLRVNEKRADINPDLQPGGYARLIISDDGCGMSPEIREKIFEPFFTTKEVGQGTGLGLAMVYGVVKQHQGAINVYSEPGKGTTFRIYLPLAERLEKDEVAEEAMPDCGGDETILIAEDEPLVRQVAVRILEKAGYTTFAATDGEEAVELFRKHADEIDLVLSDVIMPRLNGHAALQQIRQVRPDIPAVFCTGCDPDAAEVSFLSEDGSALVEKPFKVSTLLAAVRKALERKLLRDSTEFATVG